MTQLLERDPAMDTLLELAVRSASSRGQIVVLSGEAGVGKSALLSAFAGRLGPGVTVGWGHCDALITPRQLGPFYDLAPLLGPGVRAALAHGAVQATLFHDVLAAIGDLPPGTVLIFEDLHWSDSATLDLLKFLARRIAPLRVLLVMTYREGEVEASHALNQLFGDLPPAHTTYIGLEPLSRTAVQQIAQRTGRDADALYQATGGNPFFVSEVVAPSAAADRVLPRSVRDAVLARVSRVSAEERRLLEAISVAPDGISEAVVTLLLGDAGLGPCRACLARGLLVRDTNDRFRFRHELARMAVLDSLQPDVRRDAERRLLDVYLGLQASVPADLIVHHAAAAGAVDVLLAHAPRAARQAASLGAHKVAASHLAMALRHVDACSPEQAATMYQDWAHECSLFEVNAAVIDACREAVRRWRELGRADRVGDNLRWLWRLHWYRGEIDEADAAAAESLATLEGLGPSAELARAYALRAHMLLLKGRRAECIRWGRLAITMATDAQERETVTQAMVTVATAQLFDGDETGAGLMEEGLRRALQDADHEQVARAYTNYSEYAIVMRDWPLAERLVRDGLSFDTKLGLESWTGYLIGRQAQLLLDRGQLGEAESLSRAALREEGRTLLMRLPAMTTLAMTRSRQGADDADTLLAALLEAATTMREQQRLTPARLAFVEHLYIRDLLEPARQHLQAIIDFGAELLRPWDAGQVRVWARRLGMSLPAHIGTRPTPAQALELQGKPTQAAQAYDALGAPFEAALCRLVAARAGESLALEPACRGFEDIGAAAGAQAVRRLAAAQGCPVSPGRRRRGPYRAARSHPLGLTSKEAQVLTLLVEGATNAEIAQRLSRSRRTVDHHVSALLAKFNVGNRMEVILRAMAEPRLGARADAARD